MFREVLLECTSVAHSKIQYGRLAVQIGLLNAHEIQCGPEQSELAYYV